MIVKENFGKFSEEKLTEIHASIMGKTTFNNLFICEARFLAALLIQKLLYVKNDQL
jgi:hypothetical protein